MTPPPPSVPSLLAHLRELETALHRPEMRRDPALQDRLLHPRFREFGRSGRWYDKAAILALMASEAGDAGARATVHAQDFELEPMADELALLTYRSCHLQPDGSVTRAALRSSIWQRTALGWQMLFHQGTPTEGFEPAP